MILADAGFLSRPKVRRIYPMTPGHDPGQGPGADLCCSLFLHFLTFIRANPM